MARWPGTPPPKAFNGTRRRRGGQRHGFSDFPFPSITGPPPGFVDPGLEAQVRQSQRGLLDTLQDIHRQNRQGRVDTRVSRRQAQITARRGLGDIGYERQGAKQSFARDLQDLALAQQRGNEDYQTALSNLDRKYTILGSRQGQTANARGVLGEGGFAAASAEKRAANQAFETQPITTAHTRLGEDIGQKRQRARQDITRQLGRYGTLAGRTRQDLHRQLADLHRNLQRTLSQNKLQRSRAIREQGLYALDQTQQEFFQAHQQHPTVKFPSLADLRRGVTPHGRPR